MGIADKILDVMENGFVETSPIKGKRPKKQTLSDKALVKFKKDSEDEDLQLRNMLVQAIEKHPLYISPPEDPESSMYFGWNRGIALKLETSIRGRWITWLSTISAGSLSESILIPDCSLSDQTSSPDVRKMLNDCMEFAKWEGIRVDAFLDWIGYSLGISWFKKPKISQKIWAKWYETFDIGLMFLYPSDYLSSFLTEHGCSGIAGYFPSPLSVTTLLNKLVGQEDNNSNNRTESVYEPCLGAGAMLLPSSSLNLTGTDINPTMVKASAIQAFLYAPWLLYCPNPIIGLHFSEEEQRMNRYFEFSTNTRIYLGDGLLGEFVAPADIFDENSQNENIYIRPLDLTKCESLKYEELLLTTPWEEIDYDTKLEVVKAQSRELGFTIMLSNPPFGDMNKYTLEEIKRIRKSNEEFAAARQQSLNSLRKNPSPHHEEIVCEATEKVEIILTNSGQLELIF
jgi:hypothetical protein